MSETSATTEQNDGVLSEETRREVLNVLNKVPGLSMFNPSTVKTVTDLLVHVQVMSDTMQRLFDQVEELRRNKARTDSMIESAGELFLRMNEAAQAGRARTYGSGDHH